MRAYDLNSMRHKTFPPLLRLYHGDTQKSRKEMPVSEVLSPPGSAPLPDKDPRSHKPDARNHQQGLCAAIDVP